MSVWLEDLLGKIVLLGGTELPMRKRLNFVQGAGSTVTVADNPSLGTTDVTIAAGAPASAVTVDQNLTASDNGKRYYNTAAGDVVLNLPASPTVGLTYHGRNLSALGTLKLQANTGQTIQMDIAVTASSGYIRTSLKGGCFTVECYAANSWVITSSLGQWDVV